MSKLGEHAIRVVMTKLSPHLEKASAMLAYFPIFEKKQYLEPEQRLEEYVKQRALRRKQGCSEPEVTDDPTDKVVDETNQPAIEANQPIGEPEEKKEAIMCVGNSQQKC